LLATLLLDLLRGKLPEARVVSFDFRALRPSFSSAPLSLCARREADTVALWTSDSQGQLCMRATAKLA
jgi:3-methylfumaryl-CoA hydratase